LDFVRVVRELDYEKVVGWVGRHGSDVLFGDCLRELGARICELINVDGREDVIESAEGSNSDENQIAKLVMQSSLLSGGIEDRFVAHLFADSDRNELATIRQLELSTSIEILPQQNDKENLKDELCHAIINEGENPVIDAAIDLI
jgi:hypothetical protein